MSAEKTIRWLHILDLLTANSQGLTTSELHQRLNDSGDYVQAVDLRTVQRDIKEMDGSGTVRFTNPSGDGPATRWALQSGMWGRSLSPMGASTLKLILRYMKGLLPPSALASLKAQEEQADRLLALRSATEQHTRPWDQKLRVIPGGHTLLAPSLPDEILQVVYEALASERKITATYRRPGIDESSTREYSVLALIVRPPKYQLLVCTGKDPYVLNIHRIGHAELLDAGTDWPENFSLDTWLQSGAANIRVADEERMVIRTTAAMADHWRETPLGEGQQITEADNCHEVSVSLVQTDALRRYLLGLGDQVTVLAPETLRHWMATQITALSRFYK
jgi:predicted DNA-binding transcriptional regulator YafY